MANYNTFIVIDCSSKKIILNTSSARKATNELRLGRRIDVWSDNIQKEIIYNRNKKNIYPYIELEKDYIGRKQAAAEERNKLRKNSTERK